MFVAARIANGLVALVLLFLLLLFLPAWPSPTAMMMIIVFGAVVLFYVLDLLIRRKNTKTDTVFGTLWTLIFTYAVYRGSLVLMVDIPAEIAGNPILLYGTFITVYVIPCILNCAYLGRLFLKKENSTQTQ